jgi:hypothetical protein
MRKVTVVIKADGWDGYQGPLGGYMFKDGRSAHPIPLRAALRIGASIEVYDEHDVRLHPSTYPVNESPSSVGAPIVQFETEGAKPVPVYEPVTTKEDVEDIDTSPEREITETGEVREIYTRAKLEAIADKKGIAGLRDIADKFGVKGRAISELIKEILEAQ